jgi:hypothetical protein
LSISRAGASGGIWTILQRLSGYGEKAMKLKSKVREMTSDQRSGRSIGVGRAAEVIRSSDDVPGMGSTLRRGLVMPASSRRITAFYVGVVLRDILDLSVLRD